MKDIIHKLSLIGAGKKIYENRLEKAEKKIKKWSDKLKNAHGSDTSVRRRANLRIKLQEACEKRDRLKKTLTIA